MKKQICVLLSCLIMSASAFSQGAIKNWIDGGSVEQTSKEKFSPTNPDKVQLFRGEKPKGKYIVLGEASVSTDNMFGIPKSIGDVKKAMQEKAASIGGDAVIDIQKDLGSMSGMVIRYAKR